jgi:tRNA-2-methylthio-N6-dimethylallyladenosine synthase
MPGIITTMSKSYFIYTWGCAANVADAQRIAGYYESRGYQKADKPEQAKDIIFVTCSVRKSAEDRVLGLIHNFSQKFKNQEHKPKLILTGCMMHHGEERLKQLSPNLDECIDIKEFPFDLPSVREDKKHALIPISSGCNSFCTYCVVPRARGREKSRTQKEILEEINCLIKNGYEEFTLLGQNVNSFGLEKIGMSLRKRLDENKEIPAPNTQYKPFIGKPPFVKLLEEVCQIPQVKKVNFMSSNPWDFYEELIDCIAANPKINRQIHLPIQSGDNEMLKKMNRGYTREQYLALIKKIKTKIPDAIFTTDIIVGFPGETEEQFQNTVDICKKVKFKIAYIGKYSPRPGTVSAKLYDDNIPPKEKRRRWKIIEDLVNQK